MVFNYKTKIEIYRNAGGQCQCARQDCAHWGKCNKQCQPIVNPLISLFNFGDAYIFPGFEFHHIRSQEAGGLDTSMNGAFLCAECHKKTNTFGSNLTR